MENSTLAKPSKRKSKNIKRNIIIASISLPIIVVGVFVFTSFLGQEAQATSQSVDNSYREEYVVKSNIVVGVTETGSASLISTDISYEFETTVLDVHVKPGEFVNAGDTVATIDLDAFEEQYDAAVLSLENAQLSLQKEQLSADSSELNALQTYENNINNGENAQLTYDLRVAELNNEYNTMLSEISTLETQKASIEAQIATVNTLKSQLSTLNTELTTLQTELTTIENLIVFVDDFIANSLTFDDTNADHIAADADNDLDIDADDKAAFEQNKVLKEAEIVAKQDAIKAKETEIQTAESAQITSSSSQQNSQSLESQLSQTTTSLTQAYSERDNYASTMQSKLLSYEQEYEQSIQSYTNAGQTYENTVNTVDSNVTQAELQLEEAQMEVENLEKLVSDGTIIATVSGFVMSIAEEGSTINQNGTIATIADSTSANVFVSIAQEDIADIEIDMPVNIVFDAYEDITVTAMVDYISMSAAGGMQSSVSYTVGIECYVAAFEDMVIFDGMTSDVTFVEKQVNDVLIVSNKCVQLIDGKQYVLMYDENNNIIEQEVTTGFSDGFDVEITSGLNEGDIVLLESAVNTNAS